MTLVKTHFEKNGRPNPWALHDLGLAVGQSDDPGLCAGSVCPQHGGLLGLRSAARLFNLPPGLDPVTMIAVGYLGDSEQLSDTLKANANWPSSSANRSRNWSTGGHAMPAENRTSKPPSGTTSAYSLIRQPARCIRPDGDRHDPAGGHHHDPAAVAQLRRRFGGDRGRQGISMNLVIIPPGGHGRAASASWIRDGYLPPDGRVETRYGEGLRRSVIHEAGDFIFIPADVPHQPVNLQRHATAQHAGGSQRPE